MAEMANHAKEPWLSLENASWLFDRAGFVLIASLVVGVVSTVLIVFTGIEKEHHWDLLRDASNERVAALGLSTAEANEAAAKANERVAELSTQAEQLRKDAAEANAKLALPGGYRQGARQHCRSGRADERGRTKIRAIATPDCSQNFKSRSVDQGLGRPAKGSYGSTVFAGRSELHGVSAGYRSHDGGCRLGDHLSTTNPTDFRRAVAHRHDGRGQPTGGQWLSEE